MIANQVGSVAVIATRLGKKMRVFRAIFGKTRGKPHVSRDGRTQLIAGQQLLELARIQYP
jgi:hypothetical protein